MIASEDIATHKAKLRTEALARRDALSPDERAAAAKTLAARPLPVEPVPGWIVSGFMPIWSEINPLLLLKRFGDAGAQLALPAIAGRGEPLFMRAWSAGEKLVAGQWGIREPDAGSPELDPDIVLVPLAVFDRRGHRIGYGAGHYDRTLAGLRARKLIVAIGLAFAVQEADQVPVEPHDERLDLVLTEREVIDCRGA